VYVLWGSTYLANRLIITTVPLLMGGYRFVVGGTLLTPVFAVARRRTFRMSAAEFGTASPSLW
jgi:hypothetical protein